MSQPGIEPPRWEASMLEKSHSNSLSITIRNIYIWAHDKPNISFLSRQKFFHNTVLMQRIGFPDLDLLVLTTKAGCLNQCCGSERFIPDLGSEFFPSRIPDPHQSILHQKLFLSSRKYDPGCSSQNRILIFTHPGSRIQGSKKHEPGTRTLALTSVVEL